MKTADTDLIFTRAGRTGRITTAYLATALIAVMFLFDLSTAVQAAGNLMITPTRVVFEQRTRSAQVTLVNQGTETSDFRNNEYPFWYARTTLSILNARLN